MIHCISWAGFLGYYIVLAWVHSAGTSLAPKSLITEQSGIETHIDVLPFKGK